MNGLGGSVFLTGGAGFLGRGIMRRAKAENWNCRFTVYSRDEEKQYRARRQYDAHYVLGDINDFSRLRLAMAGHKTVIHTAALKYIPECEFNPHECVRVNIDGTRTVMEAAREAGVECVVCISTDKAPNPVNTYGMTKALVERLVGETFDTGSDTRYVAVRYGNVVGSTGSLWPVWKAQAASDQQLKLTDPNMTRYMMSIDDAVGVILAAEAQAPSGLVVMPFPGAVKMSEVAAAVAKYLEVPYQITGRRPGEKTHEQMLGVHELDRTKHMVLDPKYLVMFPPMVKIPEPSTSEATALLTSSKPPTWHDGDWFIQTALDSESV